VRSIKLTPIIGCHILHYMSIQIRPIGVFMTVLVILIKYMNGNDRQIKRD
jgi:uncharacterized membrane protein